MTRSAVVLALGVLAGTAAAEPVRPLGALNVTGDLTLTGPRPRNRFAVEATGYVTQRVGIYAAAHQITVEPLGDAGKVTAGIAYRAAAARPRLEVVIHGDAGVSWPLLPVVGGGVTTYLWPLTSLPFAVTTGAHAYLVVDGVEDTHLAFSIGLGLAISR